MDPYLEQDSRTVLSPLTAPNSNIQRFGVYDWLAISQESVFLSRITFKAESEYRQNTMASVATQQRLLCLSEVISHDYVGICWSQTSFPIHQPTREVLSKIPGNGQPKINMVWRHLEQMKDVAQHLKRYQIRDFLADLYLTYEYLQDHRQESMVGFNVENSAIWLNLNTSDHITVLLDDIKTSWHAIEELVLSSSCDAGPIKAVRPSLMRYEKLLRALGCSSITYPTVTRPELHFGRSVSNSLRQLRREGKLIDIKYSTEGKIIHAHRVVLAATSEKCALQFSGRWKMDNVITYDKDVDPEDFLSYHTLSTMINYAYEDEINWKEMEVLESDDADAKAVKLDILLDLHKGADCWLIPALASQVEDKILIAGKLFINLENVIGIRERAEQVRAKAVERMCAQFIEQNRDTVEKVHSGIL
jgi:sacsin